LQVTGTASEADGQNRSNEDSSSATRRQPRTARINPWSTPRISSNVLLHKIVYIF